MLKADEQQQKFAVEYQNEYKEIRMYRNKSAVSLRTLAHSLKQSINNDRQKSKTHQFVPLRNSASSVNLIGTNFTSKPMVSSYKKSSNPNEEYLIMLQSRKPSKLSDKKLVYDRDSNYSQVRYDIRSTRELMIQRKQRLLEMSRPESSKRFPLVTQPHTDRHHPYKQSDQISSTLHMLQEQHHRLQQLVAKNFCSNSLKSCNKHITEAQTLAQQLKQIQARHSKFTEHKNELQNRVMFIEEDIISKEMSLNDRIIEKEECEQFLKAYEENAAFKEEAECAMKMIALQYQTQFYTQKQRAQRQEQKKRLQAQYTTWKISQNIELKQNKFRNRLQQLKLNLMKVQTDLDSLTNDLTAKYRNQNLPPNTIRKIREYICVFFKKQNHLALSQVSHNQMDQGIDFFLCKNGLVKAFTHFLHENTSKFTLVNGTYSLKITQYCDCLKKIEHLFQLQETELHKVISNNYEQQIRSTQKQIQLLSKQKHQNLSQIQTLLLKMEQILSQESLSIIQVIGKKQVSSQRWLSKQQGLLNLTEIKTKVKELKFQQERRIFKAKQKFIRLKQINSKFTISREEHNKNQLKLEQQKQLLIKEISLWQQKIQQISLIKQGYQYKKAKLDAIIDQTIGKMKQKDQIEMNIVYIQKEVEQLKKQKIEEITKKHQLKKTNQQYSATDKSKSKLRPFSSVNNLKDYAPNPQPLKNDNIQPQTSPQWQPFKLTQNHQNNQQHQNELAQFKITRDLQPRTVKVTMDEQKLSTKTQSSPKYCQQRLSIGALNSILLSKCNIVNSKHIQIQAKSTYKSASMYGPNKINKENELNSDDLLLESQLHSRKNSNLSKKLNSSRKNSISKTAQHSTTKPSNLSTAKPSNLSTAKPSNLSTAKPSNLSTAKLSNLSTGNKLSLSTQTRKPSLSNKPNKILCNAPKTTKNLNYLISSKLLHR